MKKEGVIGMDAATRGHTLLGVAGSIEIVEQHVEVQGLPQISVITK